MEFRPDGTMIVKSGAQVLTGTYTAEPVGRRLMVKQKDVRSNGEPNCQGISADYVLSHYVDSFYVSIRDGTRGIYARFTDRAEFFTATRVPTKS